MAGEARYWPGRGTTSEPGIRTRVSSVVATSRTVTVRFPTWSRVEAAPAVCAVSSVSGIRAVGEAVIGVCQLERRLRSPKAW